MLVDYIPITQVIVSQNRTNQYIIIGPIGSEESLYYESVVTSDLVNRVAKETGLSRIDISKINHLAKNIDSKKLAELLLIAERGARRILKKLLDSGYAELLTWSQTNNFGRSTNVYKMNISKLDVENTGTN